jgi:hypothetical protein
MLLNIPGARSSLGLPGSDHAALGVVIELAMAAAGSHMSPAVGFDQPNHVASLRF